MDAVEIDEADNNDAILEDAVALLLGDGDEGAIILDGDDDNANGDEDEDDSDSSVEMVAVVPGVPGNGDDQHVQMLDTINLYQDYISQMISRYGLRSFSSLVDNGTITDELAFGNCGYLALVRCLKDHGCLRAIYGDFPPTMTELRSDIADFWNLWYHHFRIPSAILQPRNWRLVASYPDGSPLNCFQEGRLQSEQGIPNPLYCEDSFPARQMNTPAKYLVNQWANRMAMVVRTPITLIDNTKDMGIAPNQAHSEGLINNEKNIAREPSKALKEPAKYFIYRYNNNVRAADYLVTQIRRYQLQVQKFAKRKRTNAKITRDSKAMQEEDSTDMPFAKKTKTLDETVARSLYSAIKLEQTLGREGAVKKRNHRQIFNRLRVFLDLGDNDDSFVSQPTFNAWIDLKKTVSPDKTETIRKAARAFVADVEDFQAQSVSASTAA